jgi:hypothetical protein
VTGLVLFAQVGRAMPYVSHKDADMNVKLLACVPNDGVRSLERATGVERAPSGLGAELEPVLRRLLTEAVRVVKRRQTLEELLVARGEAIVGVVVGRPKGAARRPNSSVFVSVCALA